MSLELTGKTLKDYSEMKQLAELALEVWSHPTLSKSLSLSDRSNILATLLQSNQWSAYSKLLEYTVPNFKLISLADTAL